MTAARLDEALDRSVFGGKTAQLAAAVRAGLPVPAGIALSVPLVDALARDEPAGGAALDSALRSLRPPLVARSSAVGEDSEQASFAGQHLTRLNVRSGSEVREAVSAIRQSAHAPAALAYRRRLGLVGEPRMAVLAQELVDADCAGVLFSRNPLDGADELVIEASWGLGEAVVAGLVVPDRVRVGRDGRVIEWSIGRKEIVVRPSLEGGTHETEAPRERVSEPCLSDSQLRRLVMLARSCERVFGRGSDLEWAFEAGKLLLLQRRAVTRATASSGRPDAMTTVSTAF